MKIRSCQTKQVTVSYFWMSNAGKGRKKLLLEKNSILIPKLHLALDGDIKTRRRISFLQASITKWNSMRQKRQWPLRRFSSRITAGEISWGTFSSAWNDFYVEHGLAFSKFVRSLVSNRSASFIKSFEERLLFTWASNGFWQVEIQRIIVVKFSNILTSNLWIWRFGSSYEMNPRNECLQPRNRPNALNSIPEYAQQLAHCHMRWSKESTHAQWPLLRPNIVDNTRSTPLSKVFVLRYFISISSIYGVAILWDSVSQATIFYFMWNKINRISIMTLFRPSMSL